MELEQEVFNQILGALGTGSQRGENRQPAADTQQDKRKATRIAVQADVTLAPHGVLSAKPRRVSLRSLSRSGAAVLDEITRQAGDKVVLYLPKAKGNPDQNAKGKPSAASIPIVCMVMNTRLLSSGHFRIGVQFLSRGEETGPAMLRGANGLVTRPHGGGSLNILDAIVENGQNSAAKSATPVVGATTSGKPSTSPSAVAAAKGNREDRVDLKVQAMFCTYAEGRTGPISFVTVQDISLGGGVCILHSDQMQRGEQFVLQIPRPQGKPLTLICTVVGCRRVDHDSFRIGARYEARLLPDAMSDDEPKGFMGRLRRLFSRSRSRAA